MKKFAILNAVNKVINIIEAEGETQELEAVFTAHFGSTVKNIPPASLAQKDWFWHEAGNTFIRKQPYESWVLNEDTWEWEPPQEYPNQDDPSYIWLEEKQTWVHIQEQFLENYYNQVQYKGMPFTHSDGETYHIQTRDRDKTNVTGLFLNAHFFQQPGDLVHITVYENVTLGIDREIWLTLIPKYMKYVSSQHHANQAVLNILKTDKSIDVQTTFQTLFQEIIEQTQ